MNQTNFLVRVSCMTYNHAKYITYAMNGFVMQQTTFQYICTIVDDASTDGEQEVIKIYLQKYFDLQDSSVAYDKDTDYGHVTFARHRTNKNCYFAVIYLKENHYSQKKSKAPYLTEWLDTKYRAICEGDDYWIDPLKLQKQVDFLEEHEDCKLISGRIKRFSELKNQFVNDYGCYERSQYVDAVDVIEGGGLFIPTCSIVYRNEIIENYPDYCRKCHVGDYPLQIMGAMKGKVYYLNDTMAVYRIENPSSWVGKYGKDGYEYNFWAGIKSEIRMLQGFSADYPKYKLNYENRIIKYISSTIPNSIQNKELYRHLKKELRQLSLRSRFELFFKRGKFKRMFDKIRNKL